MNITLKITLTFNTFINQMKTGRRLIPLILIIVPLSGCFLDENSSSFSFEVGSSYVDQFDDPNLTEGFLEENLCMIFEDLRFIKGKHGGNDHAYVVKDGKIIEHRSYVKKKESLTDFQSIIGLSLFDAMNSVGIPSFRGRYDEDCSLTYVISAEEYATIYIEKNVEEKWIVSSYKTFDEKGFSENFGKEYDSTNLQTPYYTPSLERIRSIPMGMLFDDALFILGRPKNGVYHGLPSNKDPNGLWNTDFKNLSFEINAKWIGSSYPAFEKNNCWDGYTSYFGVTRVFLNY